MGFELSAWKPAPLRWSFGDDTGRVVFTYYPLRAGTRAENNRRAEEGRRRLRDLREALLAAEEPEAVEAASAALRDETAALRADNDAWLRAVLLEHVASIDGLLSDGKPLHGPEAIDAMISAEWPAQALWEAMLTNATVSEEQGKP